MMFFHLILLVSLWAVGDADVSFKNSDKLFTTKPIPATSRFEYARYLAYCAKTFHNLVDKCEDGITNCPLLTDRTPPVRVYEPEKIIQPGANNVEKHMAFFVYNVDTEIRSANGYPSGDAINKLHKSDFDHATNKVWKCTRLNYRHLTHYEFATTGEIDKQFSLNSTKVTLADLYVNPLNDKRSISYKLLDVLMSQETRQKPWTPIKVIDIGESIEHYLSSSSIYNTIPYSKFYFFKSFVGNMNLTLAAEHLLTGNTFIDYLNESFDVTKRDSTVPNVVKRQLKQFINLITSKWAQTSDLNQRYYEFSESYYKYQKLSHDIEKHIGMLTLGDWGQLGDFFYLNYFFGLPA